MIVIQTKRQYRREWLTILEFTCLRVVFVPFFVISSWKKKTSGVYPK